MANVNWLRGTVKSVLSGDTLVIVGQPRGGPPPEKQITLSSLKAPRLGRRDGTTKDEPFAWQSREFLRKLCIGKACVFSVDYKVDVLGDREFGSVFLGKENIGMTVVAAGWAKVNNVGTERSPHFEHLEREEAAAQAKEVGIWTKDEDALQSAVRNVVPDSESAGKELLTEMGRGKSVEGIVEQVLNAGMLRITVLPTLASVVVYVAGIMAPKARVRSESGDDNPEPYYLQSKYFAEMRVLNREVRMVLQGLDKYDNLSATVYFPSADAEVDLGQELLKNGFAKVFDRGIITGSTKLRELEKIAKQEKKGMWTNYVPAETNSSRLTDQFVGRVVEVVSGDTIVVLDKTSKTERRVQLASLRAPKMGNPSNPAADWAVEAKEFLRKLVIGKDVKVSMEYTRKIPPTPGTAVVPQRQQLSFGNVTMKGKGEDVNISERVVSAGWAGLVKHNSDEERSSIYESLVEMEAQAKSGSKGMYCGKPPPINRRNDVSAPAPGEQKRARFISRAQGYLPSFQRAGKVRGLVEYVLSAQKLKVYIPRENVTIAFSPSGINTPQRAQPARDGMKPVEAEPYAAEAVMFTREHVNQREVDLEVETMNKGGTFLGRVTVPGPQPFDLGLGLVENGLAKLHQFFDTSSPVGRQLAGAQKLAQDNKLNIWESYDPSAETKKNENDASIPMGPVEQEVLPNVVVTEVVNGSTFFVQILGDDSRIEWITEQLKDPSLTEDKPVGPPPAKGTSCIAKFTVDNLWYRGYVQDVQGGSLNVYFTDFGNSEVLSPDRLRPMDPSLAAPPPQAHQWQLAYVKVPSLEKDEDYAYDAAALLSSLACTGKQLKARVALKENTAWGGSKHPRSVHPKRHVVLSEPDGDKSINAKMLESGFARLPNLAAIRNPHLRAAAAKFEEYEAVARKEHKGIFVYGDPGDSDDEFDMPTRAR